MAQPVDGFRRDHALAASAADPSRGPGSGSAEPSAAEEDGTRPAGARRARGSFWRELPVLIIVAFLLAMLIKAFLVQAFFIPSGSMEQTLTKDDRVLVDKVSYDVRDIRRGEIVVFRGPPSWESEIVVAEPSNPLQRALRAITSAIGVGHPSEKDFIKRVIAVGGDRVQCCDPQGRVTVNGVVLEEDYVFEDSDLASRTFDPLTVPEGHVFVLGDHRSESADSRFHREDSLLGTIPEDNVIGRAFVIVWPPSRVGGLGVPDTFDRELPVRAAGVSHVESAVPAALVLSAPYLLGTLTAAPLVLWRGARRQRS